ncbi:small conductance mechanosensitive channel [Ruminococcus sp. YRD2003]|uniref:mechanosensitive ion channel family protein n=1 Tax=Ruminococcus sp. YRD2003 TaxID=1452313 RepID=UPI0008C3E06F|nr:small conductance mechanosensitive channel [Ruminococcus flavefaciens]
METTSVTVSSSDASVTTSDVNAAVESIQEQVGIASDIMSKMGEYLKKYLPLIIFALIIILVGYGVTKLITKLIDRAMKRSKIEVGAKNFLLSVIRIGLYTVVLVMALSVLKVPISSIITILGAAGLAVSLALQTCLSNLAGGFIILFSKPFVTGDIIEIDGTVGTVRAISILYTKLDTFDGKTAFIPNGKVSDAKLINYTESPLRRIDLKISVSYADDFKKAQSLICEVINNEPQIQSIPCPVVRMGAHGESSIDIDVLVWVKNSDYISTRYDLLENVKEAFDKNGIEIPYGQLDVHMK